MHDSIDLARLPCPPASAAEWRERSVRFCYDAPGLREELRQLPIGWFPLIEAAMQEVHRLLPKGAVLCTRQLKEKYATLRWYSHVESPHDDPVPDTGADGAVDWAEDVSARVCALLGTPDGEPDNHRGWWLTLSPTACRLRGNSDSDVGLNALMYPTWDD